MTWHIHETGYDEPWLAAVMDGVNPRFGSLPRHLVLESPLYQLRAFHNAGFGAAVVISGHHGAQEDLRLVAEAFSQPFNFDVFLRTDRTCCGTHAGGLQEHLRFHFDESDRSGLGTDRFAARSLGNAQTMNPTLHSLPRGMGAAAGILS